MLNVFEIVGCVAFGIAVVASSTAMQDAGRAPILVSVLLFPGAAAAGWTGFGMHDVAGFLLYIFGNMLFYCVGAYLLLRLIRRLRAGASPDRGA